MAPFMKFGSLIEILAGATSLAALILPESPNRCTRAAGTSEKEVRFSISLCAATPPTSAGRRAPDTHAADEKPRALVHKVRQLGTNRPRGKNPVGSKTTFSGLQSCGQISLPYALFSLTPI
jgi:hypothetical protein